jgi:hypothetical protein
MPGTEPSEGTNVLRFLRASVRTELIRSNFLSLAYNGVRLSSATRRFLVGKPVPDDTGETLTRQQVEWLAEKSTDVLNECHGPEFDSREASPNEQHENLRDYMEQQFFKPGQ